MKKSARDIVLILALQCGIMLVLVSIVALVYIYRKPLLIIYHKHGQASARNAMQRSWTPNGPHETYQRHSNRFQRHRKALIDLGYLEKRLFDTKFLKWNTPQTEKMLEEFRRRHPGASYTIGEGRGLSVTDRPERMPTWESLIQQYDVPPPDPCQPAIQTNPSAETPR